MAQFSCDCNVKQAFAYERDQQVPFGQVTSLTVGGTEFTPDFDSKNPIDDADVECVGIIRKVSWDGGYTDPVDITFMLSTANKQTLQGLLHSSLKSTAVAIQYDVYDFDPIGEGTAGVYYKSFYSNDTQLNGLIKKDGGKLSIELNKEADGDVASPMNYECHLVFNPKPAQQAITIATANQKNVVKRWGSAN
ncbi:MAG: hypothetical protein ACRELB_08925 [Polyangiaceae bacterium]